MFGCEAAADLGGCALEVNSPEAANDPPRRGCFAFKQLMHWAS